MPLLNKQKFVKKPIPTDLDPNEHVFYFKPTQEIFQDYDEYFERTILCNSLVWTCTLTGKTGLTFVEALESENKAKKIYGQIPVPLVKGILFLLTLTKRGNIKDLIDDLFSFVRDRYFIGETVLIINGTNASSGPKTWRIVDVIMPPKSSENAAATGEPNGLLVEAAKIKYVVEVIENSQSVTDSNSCSNTSQSGRTSTVNASHVQRTKNCITKDKIYMILKTNCHVVTTNKQIRWMVTEAAMEKHKINKITFTDIFKGDPPLYDQTLGRSQLTKLNQSLNNKSANTTPSKSHKKASLNNSKSKGGESQAKTNGKPSSSNNNNRSKSSSSSNNKRSPSKGGGGNTSISKSNSPAKSSVNAKRIAQVLAKKIIDMTDEEYIIWCEHIPEVELRELTNLDIENERIRIREEREKEKERLKNEKNKQKEYLKELKKPREDFECENLMKIPKAVPIKSKIPQEMFGDAVMILEFLDNFGDLFSLRDDFPNGFSYELLENALFSKSSDSALCNLLLFYLDSIFKCYDEEAFEETNDSDNESIYEDLNESENEDVGLENLYKNPVEKAQDRESIANLAESYFKLVKNTQGRSVKNIGLDVYTISEMLRLYFITTASPHHSKIKFWFQQRGGYTRMDEIGIDFVLNEKHIIQKLEIYNVYELEADEKLKILTSLCHQLMTQVTFRDLLEDNFQAMATLRAQHRDLQTKENRRIREETSERWKKRLESQAQAKAQREETKTSNNITANNTSLNQLNKVINKDRNSTSNDSLVQLAADEAENKRILAESNKKREEFLKKEKGIIDEIYYLQTKCTMTPLGRDRFYRRYWVFNSLPGIYVEDEEYDFKISASLETSLIMHQSTSVEKTAAGEEGRVKTEDVELVTANNDVERVNKAFSNLIASSFTQTNTEISSKVFNYERSEAKWSFYTSAEQIDALISTLNERGLRESDLKQNLLLFKSNIIENLPNPTFIKNLTLTDEEIAKALATALKENASNVEASQILTNTIVYKNNKRQLAKIQDAMQQVNNYSTITSQEFLELDLKDKLLDIEEQIYNGSLGSLKVDRLRWKAALACGEYTPLCDHLTWGNEAPRSANEITNKNDSIKYNEDELKCIKMVNNFAKALLQIEQCLERRFLRTPLGESQKTPEKKKSKKTAAAFAATNGEHHDSENDDNNSNVQSTKYQVLHNWEKSLMNCTTFSQLFIHLQTLDESIAWSKSALNARCRLCKRKGDAEKMLLCDKCDCGHHIYCLRPPLKVIPEGDWFCTDCKPKDVEKTPRKIRKSFVAEFEEDENDENSEEDDDDEEEDNESGESDESAAAPVVDKKRNSRSKKKESEESDNTEDEEEEEDDDQGEDEQNEENEEGEEVEDEDEDEPMDEDKNQENGDEDMEEEEGDKDEKNKVTAKKSQQKIRLNGNHLNRNNNHTDEEIVVGDSSEESDGDKKKNRKRKSTNERPSDIKSKNNSSSTKENKKVLTSKNSKRNLKENDVIVDQEEIEKYAKATRAFRNRNKKTYNEMALSDVLSGIDTDEDNLSKSSKRIKTNNTPPKAILNDSPINNNTNSRNTEMVHRLKLVEKLLNEMMKSPDGWPFLKPVSRRDAPDYFEVIEKPMDFSTIKNKLNNFKYDDYTNTIDDIRLVFSNCHKYNEPGSDIYKTGMRLSRHFEANAKQAGLLDYIPEKT